MGSRGGANSRKSVARLSSIRSNSLAAMSPSPGMNGSSELTSPTKRKSHALRARHASRSKIRGQTFQHQVELARRDVAVAGHERQLRIDLTDEEKVARLARAARQQIEREVGVAAQAETRLARTLTLGDELRHHVDATVEHVAQRMGVVGADVTLLRGGDAEPRAGLEEEFVDLDVRRQRARVQRERIGELGIAGEHAVDDRLEEAPFEIAFAARLLQGQRGEDAQIDRRIRGRALK